MAGPTDDLPDLRLVSRIDDYPEVTAAMERWQSGQAKPVVSADRRETRIFLATMSVSLLATIVSFAAALLYGG